MANSTTNLDTLQTGASQKEVTANALFDAVSPSVLYGRRASTSIGLTWGYYGGYVMTNGAPTSIPNGTIVLIASTTNYVEADTASGAVYANTTGFTAGRMPLYAVVTSGSAAVTWTDYRIIRAPRGRLSKSVAGGANVTLTRDEADNEILEFTGVITASIQVIVPLGTRQYTVFNGTTGAFTLTVIGATGTGIIVGHGTRAIVYADGTNVVRVTPDT